jgi:hypothetical protein
MALSTGATLSLIGLILLIAGVVLYLVVFRTAAGVSCTPTADQKLVAGGDGVLKFVYDDSSNCVSSECVEGYNLDSGICSKAAPAVPAVPAPTVNSLEGMSIICNGDKDDRFRMVDGQLRNYGSMDILRSWDPNYADNNATTIDCDNVPRGPPMNTKP